MHKATDPQHSASSDGAAAADRRRFDPRPLPADRPHLREVQGAEAELLLLVGVYPVEKRRPHPARAVLQIRTPKCFACAVTR